VPLENAADKCRGVCDVCCALMWLCTRARAREREREREKAGTDVKCTAGADCVDYAAIGGGRSRALRRVDVADALQNAGHGEVSRERASERVEDEHRRHRCWGEKKPSRGRRSNGGRRTATLRAFLRYCRPRGAVRGSLGSIAVFVVAVVLIVRHSFISSESAAPPLTPTRAL